MALFNQLFNKIKSLFQRSKERFKEKKYPFLKSELQKKADILFNKKLEEFIKRHKRKPDRNEIFLLVASSSHDTIRQKGRTGHWTRQRVRKYLILKNNIRKDYIMQKPNK